LMLTLTS